MSLVPSEGQKSMFPIIEEFRKEVERLKKENEQLQQVKKCNLHIITHSAYQLCPKCNGQGIVSKPPWVAGDVNEWTSSAASYICDLCNGAKVIPQNCG